MSREGGKRKERTEEYLKWEERKGKRDKFIRQIKLTMGIDKKC